MLLATIALLTPAVARFRYFMPGGPMLTIGGTSLFVVVCLVYDRLSHGRIHPAFLLAGSFSSFRCRRASPSGRPTPGML